MGALGGPPATVANPRHAELVAALAQSTTLQGSYDVGLDKLVSAMKAHAWTGGTSDSFFRELHANVTNLHRADLGCVDNVQAALIACPETKPNPAAKDPVH